ncbi:hypothetical protein ABPG74_008753 [Tetrahymena malaccensis]
MSEGDYDYNEDMGQEDDYYYDENNDDYQYDEEPQHNEEDYHHQMEEETPAVQGLFVVTNNYFFMINADQNQQIIKAQGNQTKIYIKLIGYLEQAAQSKIKNKVPVQDQQDIIDFLISDHKGPITALLQQIEPMLLNKEEMQLIFLRIGKLLNEIKRRIQLLNNGGSWKFEKDNLNDLNDLIEFTFRFLYIYQYSSLEQFIDKTVLLKLDFDKPFTKSLLNLLLKIDDYAENISFAFTDNVKKIFVFCLNPNEPFTNHDDGILNTISTQLIDFMGIEPTHLVFDTLILAYFSNPLRMSVVLTQNIMQITSQLESYLQSVDNALKLNEQLLVLKMIQLLIFASQSDAKILNILISEELDKRLYDTVKFSDVSFIGDGKKQWSDDARLIQSIVILIKIIISGKKKIDQRFAQTLLDDFLFLINQNKFSFIYSIIVPILTTNDTQYVPFCLHKTWDINSVQNFNKYLKEISKKGANANQILTDCRVPSDLLDERQREYFYNSFIKTGQNQDVKGVWRKIMQIDRDNPTISIAKTLPLLENEPQTLFIFNCSYQGTTIKFGVYVKNKIESFKNLQQNNVFDKSSKNLRATSNSESFFFYMDDTRMFHLKSNQRKKLKQQNGTKWISTSQEPFAPNMKDFIRIEYSGISFILDEEIAIYINFGNTDLSKFDIPFQEVDLEDAFIASSKLNAEEIFLENAEIWHLEQENSNAKIDSYLQMFSQKEDLQSIYIQYLKYFRLEKISIVPHYITLQSFVTNFIHQDYNNKKVVKKIASKLDDELQLSSTIKQLEYIYDGSNTNKILDLIVPYSQANLLKLPFEEEFSKFYEVNKNGKNLMIEIFQNQCQGITKILQIMDQEAQKQYSQNLMIFFFEAQKFLGLPQFANHLIIQKDFFKIILQLLFTQQFANNKVGIVNFHQAVYMLFKSLRRIFKYDKSSELRTLCFRKNILQDILSKFEIYNGNLPVKRKSKIPKVVNEVFQESSSQSNQSSLSHYGSGGSSNLSKKGVGYGNGSSDTSWMKNYSSGYSTAVSEDALKNQNNQYNNYSAPIIQKQTFNNSVLGLKQKQDNLIYNDTQTIKSYVGSEFVAKIMKQLSACIQHFFEFDYSFEINSDIYTKIKLSTLNPILINVFDTNSLLDSTKRASFFKPILNLLQNIAKTDELLDFFVWTEDHLAKLQGDNEENEKIKVEEVQNQKCLYSLLSSMRDQAEFFEKNILDMDQNESLFDALKLSPAQKEAKLKEIEEQKQMIQLYLKTFEIVEKALKDNDYLSIKEVDDNQNQEALNKVEVGKMHTEQFFNALLKPLCVSASVGVTQKHHYSTYFNSGNPSPIKMQRLIKEIADLAHSLPMTPQSSIFVRYDTTRMDVMKSLIFGAEDTPYAHGAFIFDMFFDDTYPQNSPKVNLATTGSAKIRFNPNLYHCGKVCLSLLGTWRGSSNENWNPNISTILQLLVSIQAIVMSEYVYFNEPGYEGHAGTAEGDKLNRGYQNIVKIGNIRYAMIEQINNPPPEFKEVIMMSFFLKKDMILKECEKWLSQADQPAEYSGLVSSHNSTFCTELSGDKYKKVLQKEISNLKDCFEKLKINVSQNIKFAQKKKKVVEIDYEKPSILFQSEESFKPKVQTQEKMLDEGRVVDVNNVNISYDDVKKTQNKQIDVENSEVTNRWSRYIGALGIDAVKKQANANVLLVGLNHVGVEIAKNIVLSGVKRFSIVDQEKVTLQNMIGQFFLSEEDIGKNRAEVSIKKIQALNEYVSCDFSMNYNDLFNQTAFFIQNYNVVILSNLDTKLATKINNICREKSIGFIYTQSYSVYSRVFCDFGSSFTVIDKDGEQAQEYLIKSISRDNSGLITLQTGTKHSLQDGDIIELKEVISQSDGKSFNLQQFKVKIKDNNSFYIGDTQQFGTYNRNGIAKHIKQSQTLKFKSLEENLSNPVFEENLLPIFTEEETASRDAQNICFNIIDQFVSTYNRLPRPWNIEDASNFYQFAIQNSQTLQKLIESKQEKIISQFQSVILRFAFTCQGYIPSQGAVVGGIVAQETVKSITKKWVPINQLFIYSSEELVADVSIPEYIQKYDQKSIQIDSYLQNITNKFGLNIKNDKYDSLRVILGEEAIEKISNANTFIIGAGAIGCELMKNLSMIGFGKQGSITLTDPDIIENSNLNRQFLFREKHIRQPKSSVAAAAAISMNKDLKNSITARLDKVYEQTEHIFNDTFFQKQNIILNALDNVQARKYMDLRCIQNRRALIDSGTLGPKGHVQVIIPHLTETYGSQQDPQEEGDIPHCTLKMFPEQTLHCVEWARDKFGRMYQQKPQSLQRVLEAFKNNQLSTLEEKTLNEGLSMLKKYPKNFDDCLQYGLNKFYKLYNHNILSLLHIYPHNHKNKDGSFFWTLPKRPPNAQQFDPTNNHHLNFVLSCAALQATVFNIQITYNLKDANTRAKLSQQIQKIKIPSFKIDENKLKSMKQDVDKEKNKQENKVEMEIEQPQKNLTPQQLVSEIKTICSKFNLNKIQISPQEFEKDVDDNYHIDLLHSMANCRAINYTLEPMEWIDVKLKAGKIIPALVTTTSIVAGLQIIETIKILKEVKSDFYKNAFLNLSLPLFVQPEPQKAEQFKLGQNLNTTVWDRWEIKVNKENDTLEKLFGYLLKTYKIYPHDVFQGNKPIYIEQLMLLPNREQEKNDLLSTKLNKILELKSKEDNFVDINVTFTQSPEYTNQLKGVPQIRLFF